MVAKTLTYEVTLDVDRPVLADFDRWLESHVREVLALDGFLSASVDEGEAEEGQGRRVVRYRMRDRQALDEYLATHAERMRADGQERFGERMRASRRTWLAKPGPDEGKLFVPEVGFKRCQNCEAPLMGTFCSSCGQRNRRRLPRLIEFMGELLGEVFEYDSRFWKTLWPLLRRPGFLTREYIDGRRVSYLPPLRMFLVLSVFFFLLAGLTDNIQVDASVDGAEGEELVQADDPPEAPAPEEMDLHVEGLPFLEDPDVQQRLVEQYTKVEERPELLARAMAEELPTMMLAFLPVFGLVLMMLYPLGDRRYVEHLILSIHYHSFFFLEVIILMLLFRFAGALEAAEVPGQTLAMVVAGLSTAVVVIWTPIYLFRSLRVVYGQGWFVTLIKFLLLNVAYLVALGLTTAITAVIAGLNI